LGDRVEKRILHLGDLKLKELTEGMKEKVPTEEDDLREAPVKSLRSSASKRWILEEGVTGRWCLERDKGLKEKATVRGLNTPGPVPGQTLSRFNGHCLGGPDFVWEKVQN
jgi:hypothetical protein